MNESRLVRFERDVGGAIPLSVIPASLKLPPHESTGVLSGGLLSIGTPNTTFSVSACTLFFVDETDPVAPVRSVVQIPVQSNITIEGGINSRPLTYVGVNSSGNIFQSSSPLTAIQRRTIAPLGAVVHTNLLNVNAINQITGSVLQGITQLWDFMYAVGPINLSGNSYSASGANLSIKRSAGEIFKAGSNYANSTQDPHTIVTAESTDPITNLRYRSRTGEVSGNVSVLDPTQYDLNGVLTAVPNNKFTIQRVALFSSGLTRIQYGQTVFQSLDDAVAGINSESFITEPNIAENGLIRAFIILKSSATDLTNPAHARIILASRINGVTTGGGGTAPHNHAGQVRVNYTGLTLSNFTAGVNKTFLIGSATPTVAASPTTTWPYLSTTSYDPEFYNSAIDRLRENNFAGQAHSWRIIGSFSGKNAAMSGILEIEFFNPDSGFTIVSQFNAIVGATAGTFVANAISIADPASLDPGRGYQLRARASFTDSGLSIDISSVTRISAATENAA